MQLYQSRGFGEFFQDTFSFLKENGKHVFKNYLIINGAFLMIMMVLMYVFTKFYTSVIFDGLIGNGTTMVDDYMNENMGLFVTLFVIFIIVALLAAVISFSFIPIYLKLYVHHKGANFGTSELVDSYKSNGVRILIFLVCGFCIGIPLVIIFGVVGLLLAITIIGLLLLPVLIGGFSLFYNMTLMEYLEEKRGVWDSFFYAWTLISTKFFPAVGSVGIFFLMSYVVQSVFSLIPYIFGIASLVSTIDNTDPDPAAISATMTLVMLGVFFLSFFAGALLSVIVQLNQGIVFYSLKEENENTNTLNVIDQIGSGE